MFEIGDKYTIKHGIEAGKTGTISKIEYRDNAGVRELNILVMLAPKYGVWCKPFSKKWS